MKLKLNKRTIADLASDDLLTNMVMSEDEQMQIAGGANTWEHPPCEAYSMVGCEGMNTTSSPVVGSGCI